MGLRIDQLERTYPHAMSKPTLTDWYKHIPTYGGVAIMLLIQTVLLLILLRKSPEK